MALRPQPDNITDAPDTLNIITISRISHHLAADILITILLLIPGLLYLALLSFWQANDLYHINGDEPHYLLIADSLVRDGDLMVANNYAIDTPVRRAIQVDLTDPTDYPGHVRNGYSVHGVGLPIVLALPYSLDGVAGGKLFMVALAALWPLLMFWVLVPIVGSRLLAAAFACVLAAGLPFLPASNQIFPDLPGGLVILLVATIIWRAWQGGRMSVWHSLMVGLLIAWLPWLHLRLSAPVLVLLAGYALAITRQNGRKANALWAMPLLAAASLLGLCLYNLSVHGSLFGSYEGGSLSLNPLEFGMIFLGLHWDIAQGMFMQQPLLLLGLLGLVPFVRASPRFALWLLLLYLAVLLPNTMHTNWYGGFSIAGRFAWAGVGLWVFPAACGVKLIARRGPLPLLALLIAAVALQYVLAQQWLGQDYALFNEGFGSPLWAAATQYAQVLPQALWLRLPYFKQFDQYWRHWPNALSLLVSAALMVCGALWARGLVQCCAGLAGLSLVFVLTTGALMQPALNAWSITADALSGAVGELAGTARVARAGRTAPGHLTYGPYIKLPAGIFELALAYDFTRTGAAPDAALGVAGRWDIALDRGVVVVAGGDLIPAQPGPNIFRYTLVLSPPYAGKAFELRVRYLGQGDLSVQRLTITPTELR